MTDPHVEACLASAGRELRAASEALHALRNVLLDVPRERPPSVAAYGALVGSLDRAGRALEKAGGR